jgi:hypothetical protein
MDLTPIQTQFDNKSYYYGYQELTFESNPTTADGIFGPQIQSLNCVNPVIPPNSIINLIVPSNLADQQLYNYSVRCKYSICAIITGTGALGTYVGPFSIPVKTELFGNISGATPKIFINGSSPLASSFLFSNDVIRTNDKISTLNISSYIDAKISQSMDSVIANAYFNPDIPAGDWFLQGVVKFEIIAMRKY